MIFFKKKYKKFNEEFSYKIFNSIDEIEKIRPIWKKMQNHPNTDIELYLKIISLRKEIENPYIIILYRNDNPVNMMIGRIENKAFGIRLGYKSIFKPKVRSLNIIDGGITGETDDLNVMRLMWALKSSVNTYSLKIDMVLFNNLKIDTPIYKAALEMPVLIFRHHHPVPVKHWQIILPETYDAYQQTLSKSTRHNLRRKERILKNEFGDKFNLIKYTRVDDFEVIMNDMESIARKTYHRGLGVGFIRNQESEERIKLLLQQNAFSAYIVYIDKKPVAFNNGIKFQNVFYLDTTGYDPDYNKYSIGGVLILKIIEDLYQSDGSVKVVDYGIGDAVHKHSFCNHYWEESDIYIFANTVKGMFINFTIIILTTVAQYVRKILEKTNLLIKIKKIWRRKILDNTNISGEE